MPGHAGDIGVIPSAQLRSLQQDCPPGRLQEPPFCCPTPSGQAGPAQESSLTHTQHSFPAAVPRYREMGVAVKAGEQMESKNPLKALLPMAISCLFPTSRDHKCFLSKATLLQRAGRGQCPPLPKGGLPGNRDGTADTLERPGGQWGTLPGSSSPQSLHQQALQTSPRMLRYLWPSVSRTVPAPSLSTPPASPRSSTRHRAQKHKKSQPWQTWTSPNGQRSAQALPVAKALTALSERLSGTVLAPQRLPVMSTSNCFWLTTRPP